MNEARKNIFNCRKGFIMYCKYEISRMFCIKSKICVSHNWLLSKDNRLEEGVQREKGKQVTEVSKINKNTMNSPQNSALY